MGFCSEPIACSTNTCTRRPSVSTAVTSALASSIRVVHRGHHLAAQRHHVLAVHDGVVELRLAGRPKVRPAAQPW
jgi:hypothetical protein